MKDFPISTRLAWITHVMAARRTWPVATARVVGALLLTALAAQVRIPVPGTDVPMTLQLLAVLSLGLVLPVDEAVASMALYLLCGVCGLPVFFPGSAGLFGPTGGYLLGFVLAAAAIGLVRGPRNGTTARMFIAAALGGGIVLASGAAWRAVWIGDRGFAAAMTFPFVPKAVIEVLLAVALARRVSRWRTRAGERNIL